MIVASTEQVTFSCPPPLNTKFFLTSDSYQRSSFHTQHFSTIFDAVKAMDHRALYLVKKHFLCLNGSRNSLTINQPMQRYICKTFGLKDTAMKRSHKHASKIYSSTNLSHLLCRIQANYTIQDMSPSLMGRIFFYLSLLEDLNFTFN